ncbi:hypothetical protein LCGC14_1629960 [marine sediment metagenome]|uniref:Uncharacterized protein n=1 Tax=marine sediment metagenome TaxID=412755 RepID=A0A0F9L2M0_9ZZZZ
MKVILVSLTLTVFVVFVVIPALFTFLFCEFTWKNLQKIYTVLFK